MIPNFELRALARKAIKPAMQVLIVIALVATLPGLISETVTILTESSPTVAFTPVLNDYLDLGEKLPDLNDAQILVSMAKILQKAEGILTEYVQGKGLIWGGMSLMSIVLTPALMMGLYRALICAIRKQDVSFAMAWPGWKRFYKGVLVSFLTVLMIFVWMLPGVLAATVSLMYLPASLASVGYSAGMILSMVLGVRAGFSYEMAPFVLADDPTVTLRAALRRSRQVMKGRRMLLFSLELTFFVWMMCLRMLQSMLMGLLGTVIGLTLGMFASLFLQVYMSGAVAVFYEIYVVKGLKPRMSMPMREDGGEQLTDDENDGIEE